MRPADTWQVLRSFLPVIWPHKNALAASIFFSLLAASATVAAPWPLKFIIDSVLGQQPLPDALDHFLSGASDFFLIFAMGFIAIAIAGGGAVCSAIEKNIDAGIREKATLALRVRVLNHVQSLSITHRVKDRTGELALQLVDDVHHVVRLLTKTAPLILRHVVTSLVIFIVMFRMEFRLAAGVLVLVLLLAWLMRHYARSLANATRRKRREEGRVAGLTQEILRGLPSIQALGAEEVIRRRFMESNRKSLAAGVKETRAAVSMERTMQLANGVAMAVMVVSGAILVLHGNLTVGGLTVYVAYLVQLLKPVEKINELASAVARGISRAERLFALLSRPPAFRDAPGALALDRAKGLVELRDVSFAYPGDGDAGHGPIVLRNVNLVLAPGALTVLTGPSGAGKSTLLHLLLRIIEPTAGELFLDGMPYAGIRLARLRAQFAAMLQEPHIFAGTVRHCLQPPDRKSGDDELWRALEMVALRNFVRELPGRLDAHLGEAGVNLSGGQRARLSLARALALDRPILLLDEPLANIDHESQQAILAAVEALKARHTCLAVSHQTEMTDIADRVLTLEASGRLICRSGPRTSTSQLVEIVQ